MKHIPYSSLLLMTSLVLSACAHRTNKSATEYGWRVEGKGGVTTNMPNYVLSPEAYTAAANTAAPVRAPASDKDISHELNEAEKKPSLRRLYFRSLYQQYRDLHQAGSITKTLNSCPSFHHDKLLVDENTASVGNFAMNMSRPAVNELAYYPEWMLPHKKTAKASPIWKRKGDGNKLIGLALKVHAGKVRRELRSMCEEGSSDAYFRLENMVTYFAGRPEKQAKMGLESFLKIPVFSTMLLLRSTQVGSNQFNTHDRDLIGEVHGGQFERYIFELRKRRFQSTTGAL